MNAGYGQIRAEAAMNLPDKARNQQLAIGT